MRSIKSAAIAGILLIAAGFSGFAAAQSTQTVTIGQADMEKVFGQYRPVQDFQAEIEKVQEDFQKAQEEGNQQKLMEIQQDFQIKQNMLMQTFQEDLRKASAAVSGKMNLHVIAVEILYHSDEAEVTDITDELIEHMK